MSTIIQFPTAEIEDTHNKDDAQPEKLSAIANSQTVTLIQEALDEACVSKNWKETKKKIEAAIRRGHIRAV